MPLCVASNPRTFWKNNGKNVNTENMLTPNMKLVMADMAKFRIRNRNNGTYLISIRHGGIIIIDELKYGHRDEMVSVYSRPWDLWRVIQR